MQIIITLLNLFYIFSHQNAQPNIKTAYDFRIGLWEVTSKYLIGPNKWKTGKRTFVFYKQDEYTFIEKELDTLGKVENTIQYRLSSEENIWENTFISLKTNRILNYKSKIIDGVLTEIIDRKNSVNQNQYNLIDDTHYTYTATRTIKNGPTFVNFVGDIKRITATIEGLKDSDGFLYTAPVETYQYAFKLGTFLSEYKILESPNSYKTGKGKTKNWVNDDGLSLNEINIDENGKIIGEARYSYNVKTGYWDNVYKAAEGKPTKFNAEIRNGKMVEFLNSKDQYGEFNSTWTYELLNDSVYTYRGLRQYSSMPNPIETIFSTSTRIKTD